MKTVQEYLELWGLTSAFEGVPMEGMILRTYKDGEPLFFAGQEVDYAYLLVEGRCRLFSISREGREVLVNYKEALGLFGDMEILVNLEFKLSMAAAGSAVVLKIPRKVMEKTLLYRVEFLRFLAVEMAEKMHLDSASQIQVILRDGKSRVARLLWLKARAEGKKAFSFSCMETARDAGISERQLSRVLNEWEDAGIIKREGRRLRILDEDFLKRLESDV
ncbi:MAG: Crp/Fnr family transcriptional regulator [Eubacteriales bacterium]|nr:Crp/Fnr family transcriptional regulator [Eubacteriales bacterium]